MRAQLPLLLDDGPAVLVRQCPSGLVASATGREQERVDEGKALLGHLCDQAATLEYQVRFRWAADSLAFWDNRAVQHYASSDYWPQRRVMERASIVGTRPTR